MPIYVFTCPKGHVTEQYRPVSKYTSKIRCKCKRKATITVTNSLYVRTFKPYVEENFNGKPIEITSSEQRERLCKQHHVTYDTVKNFTKPKVKSALDDIDFGMVKAALNSGRTPDGEKLDKPVTKKESFDDKTVTVDNV